MPSKSEQFFGGTELENGFDKSKHFTTNWLIAFSSDTPQSIKRQNKHKTGILDHQWRVQKKITTGVQERKRTPSVYTTTAFSFACRK